MSEDFIVEKMDKLFSILKRLCFNFESYGSVEIFVLILLIASFVSFCFSQFFVNLNLLLKIAYLILPVYIIYNIIIYQINILLFDYRRAIKQNKSYSLKSYTRSFILLGINYLTIIFCFAIIYHVSQFNFAIYQPINDCKNPLINAFSRYKR